MARKPSASKETARYSTPPKDLSEHPFYGMASELDEEQRVFRDAIWSNDYDIVFCNAKSGSGKTTIAVATAMLMYEYGLINGIVYMSAAGVHEYKQGLLPGSLEEKSQFNHLPLKQALIKIGHDPEKIISSDINSIAQKEGTAAILAQTDSYIRGINIGDIDNKTLLLVDECQNFTRSALRAVLSRLNNGKAVVIGHDKQCDLKYPQDSAFTAAIALYQPFKRCKVCNLSHSYRGWIAEIADMI